VYEVNNSDKIRTIPEQASCGIGVEWKSSSSAPVQRLGAIPNPKQRKA